MAFKRKASYTFNKRKSYGRPSKKYRAAKATGRRGRRRYMPSRVYGRKTYNTTQRIVNSTLKSISESKFCGYQPVQCIPPVGKPAGTQPISYHFFNTGTDLSALLPEFPAEQIAIASQGEMNMFEFNQGDAKNERIGASMYIKHAHVKLEINMERKSDISRPGNPTVTFRLMILKAKRSIDKFGEHPDPGNSIFIDTENTQFGYDDTLNSTFMHMNQPINKRKWSVYKETKFTLSSTYQQQSELGAPAQAFVNSKYPNRKLMNIKLPIGKKCNFGAITNTPSNVDTQWFIVLQAVNTNYCSDTERPDNYSVNIVGTTSALDN